MYLLHNKQCSSKAIVKIQQQNIVYKPGVILKVKDYSQLTSIAFDGVAGRKGGGSALLV